MVATLTNIDFKGFFGRINSQMWNIRCIQALCLVCLIHQPLAMKLEEFHLDQKDLIFLKNYKSPEQKRLVLIVLKLTNKNNSDSSSSIFCQKNIVMRAIRLHVIRNLDVSPKIVLGYSHHLLKALEQKCGCSRETIV